MTDHHEFEHPPIGPPPAHLLRGSEPWRPAPVDSATDAEVLPELETPIDRSSIPFKLGKVAGRIIRVTGVVREKALDKIYGGPLKLPELVESDLEARSANAAEFERLAETAREALTLSTQTSPYIARISQSENRFGDEGAIHQDYSELAGNTFREVAEALAHRLNYDKSRVIDHEDGTQTVHQGSYNPLSGPFLKLREHTNTLFGDQQLFGSEIKIVEPGGPTETRRQVGIDTAEIAMSLHEMVGVLEQTHRHPDRPERSIVWHMNKEQLLALVGLAQVGAEISAADNDPEVIEEMRRYFDRSGPNAGDLFGEG